MRLLSLRLFNVLLACNSTSYLQFKELGSIVGDNASSSRTPQSDPAPCPPLHLPASASPPPSGPQPPAGLSEGGSPAEGKGGGGGGGGGRNKPKTHPRRRRGNIAELCKEEEES